MLVALLAEIALVRIRVGQVPGFRVVHDRLGDLAEGGHQSVDQQEDEQETHPDGMLARLFSLVHVGHDGVRAKLQEPLVRLRRGAGAARAVEAEGCAYSGSRRPGSPLRSAISVWATAKGTATSTRSGRGPNVNGWNPRDSRVAAS